MKFVIRSLLLVSLLLQLTSALRKCFNQDENLMLTVILIAFSVIGIIGLTLNNRFILIIFAACITLIFIASITIHIISRTERDASQPKVPRYLSVDDKHKSPTTKSQENRKYVPNSVAINRLMNRDRAPANHRQFINKNLSDHTKPFLVTSLTDDYPEDGSTSIRHHSLRGSPSTPVAVLSAEGKQVLSKVKMSTSADVVSPDDEEDDSNHTVNEEWLAYERLQYQRYTSIISQSIDLILQTILAFWLALLLDEESDTCFGAAGGGYSDGHATTSGSGSSSSSSGASRRRQSRAPSKNNSFSRHDHEGPIYNYNGVRYSIRPDSNPRESVSRVATIYR